MRLRLMVEIEADKATVEDVRAWVATQRRVNVDPGGDEYPGVVGTIVGAVPVEQEPPTSLLRALLGAPTPGLLGS